MYDKIELQALYAAIINLTGIIITPSFIMPRVKLYKEEEVLDKALELFWKQGYNGTSMQELVSYLGINRASLYSTFGSKKELFDKAFAQYRSINLKGMEAFLATQSNVKDGLKSLFAMGIKESVNDCDRKGCFVVNTTTELLPDDEELMEVLKENKRMVVSLFYKFLLSGEKSREIKKGKNLESMAELLFTIYAGIKLVAKIEPSDDTLNSTIGVALALLD